MGEVIRVLVVDDAPNLNGAVAESFGRLPIGASDRDSGPAIVKKITDDSHAW